MANSRANVDPLEELRFMSYSTKELLKLFKVAVFAKDPPKLDPGPKPNPLNVLKDACEILKARATTLSLLIINQPFSPRAITEVLSAINNSCLVTLSSSFNLCQGDRYTEFLRRFMRASLLTIYIEVQNLIEYISPKPQGHLFRDKVFLSAGILSTTAEKLIVIGESGIVQEATFNVKEYQVLFQDAIDELEQWDPDDDDEFKSLAFGGDSDDEEESDQDQEKTVIFTPGTSEDEGLEKQMQQLDLNPMIGLKATVLRHMRFVRLLYPALLKHRIQNFPTITALTEEKDLPSPNDIKLFDETIQTIQDFGAEADEIAGALYNADEEEVITRVSALINKAKACAKITQLGYDGKEDAFTAWAGKWITRADEMLNDTPTREDAKEIPEKEGSKEDTSKKE